MRINSYYIVAGDKFWEIYSLAGLWKFSIKRTFLRTTKTHRRFIDLEYRELPLNNEIDEIIQIESETENELVNKIKELNWLRQHNKKEQLFIKNIFEGYVCKKKSSRTI